MAVPLPFVPVLLMGFLKLLIFWNVMVLTNQFFIFVLFVKYFLSVFVFILLLQFSSELLSHHFEINNFIAINYFVNSV
jgi:hypothetical protein